MLHIAVTTSTGCQRQYQIPEDLKDHIPTFKVELARRVHMARENMLRRVRGDSIAIRITFTGSASEKLSRTVLYNIKL
jgi:hypothetical protein